MHKTGTTAIQESLVEAQESLRERGVLYPETGRSGPGLTQLARELKLSSGTMLETPGDLELLEDVRGVARRSSWCRARTSAAGRGSVVSSGPVGCVSSSGLGGSTFWPTFALSGSSSSPVTPSS
jgi:hypothetical protein